MESDQERHAIFSKDPADWMQYVHKEVLVTTEEGTQHQGWIYTIDPVSESVALIRFHKDKSELDVEVVMGHIIRSLTVLNDNVDLHLSQLDQLLKPKNLQNLSPDELEGKKEKLKAWLLKNRLPVSVTGDNGELLSVSDALFVEPPYESENCRSTNEIILGRIQGLIKNMPNNVEEW